MKAITAFPALSGYGGTVLLHDESGKLTHEVVISDPWPCKLNDSLVRAILSEFTIHVKEIGDHSDCERAMVKLTELGVLEDCHINLDKPVVYPISDAEIVYLQRKDEYASRYLYTHPDGRQYVEMNNGGQFGGAWIVTNRDDGGEFVKAYPVREKSLAFTNFMECVYAMKNPGPTIAAEAPLTPVKLAVTEDDCIYCI